MALKEYQVVGRKVPTEQEPVPKLFRMRLFAPNESVAKSRYWYFLKMINKVKKATGEIVAINQIYEPKPLQPKVFGIWIRYDSRSGTHNMYKEFRDTTRVGAVEAMYQDMAARHRARFRSIRILKVVTVENKEEVRRSYVKQLLDPKLKFPLPHRRTGTLGLAGKKVFAPHRPTTFY